MKRVLIGGSPCTNWSIAKNVGRETKAEGVGWTLFENYLIAKEKFNPDFFLYENNWSASKEIKEQISKELGQPIQRINSNLVSCQNRDRFYCHNFSEVSLPVDRCVLLRDIINYKETDDLTRIDYVALKRSNVLCNVYGGKSQNGAVFGLQGKSKTLSAGTGINGRGVGSSNSPKVIISTYKTEGFRVFKVVQGVMEIKGVSYEVPLQDGYYEIRSLTLEECCKLQTIPTKYFKESKVSSTQCLKGLGNGWTAEVITHLLKNGLKEIDREEQIEVLSMYDGIGTGMYCLKQLGFKNITYKAYEIDKYAITVATSNYSNIIECGDAFQVREVDWKY